MVCATSLLLACSTERVGPSVPGSALLAPWCVFFAVCLWTARDPADRVTVATWGAFLAATHFSVAARVGRAELTLLRVLTILPMNMLGTDYGKWKLEMPKQQFISLLKRDVNFYTALLRETQMIP